MIRNVLRSKALWALVLPLAVCVSAYAGGADCNHGKASAANADKGAGCPIEKNVVKSAKLIDDGAVITLKGKTPEAIEHIKDHLSAHAKGEKCEGCLLSEDGVQTEVKMDNDGGSLTVHAKDAQLVKEIQEWANKPTGDCCRHKGEKA